MTGNNGTKLAAMVVYYLPSKTTKGTGIGFRVPNGLRKAGFVSFDGSCYFGHLDAVAALDPIFKLVESVGGRWQVVPFVETQWEDIRRVARAALEKDADAIRSVLTEKVDKAQEMFAAANREQSVKGIKKASGYLGSRVRLAEKRLAEAEMAALAFDLMFDADSIFGALRAAIAAERETVAMVRATVKARIKAAKSNPNAPWSGAMESEEVA